VKDGDTTDRHGDSEIILTPATLHQIILSNEKAESTKENAVYAMSIIQQQNPESMKMRR